MHAAQQLNALLGRPVVAEEGLDEAESAFYEALCHTIEAARAAGAHDEEALHHARDQFDVIVGVVAHALGVSLVV